MLKIRAEQETALRQTALAAFEERAVAEAREHWPAAARREGDAGLAKLVREGTSRAAALGFTTEKQVLRYLNLTLALGPGFAEDARYPWAAPILGDGRRDPNGKLDTLVE